MDTNTSNYEDRFISNQKVIELFHEAARLKRPLSLARFGHSEMSVAYHSYTPWVNGWKWKDYVGASGSPAELQTMLREALAEADIVGLHRSDSHEEADRKSAAEAHALFKEFNIQTKAVCNAWIAHALISDDTFWGLLQQLNVVLIGRRAKEAELYFQKKGVKIVGTYILEGPGQINQLIHLLGSKSKWDIALISAGIPATILAPKLSRTSGKLAIDFGHAMDKIIEGEAFNRDRIAEAFLKKKNNSK